MSKARIQTTPWARNAARRAHLAIARELAPETPFSIGDLAYFLDQGATGGLTMAETLAVVEAAMKTNRHPSDDLARLAMETRP